MIGGGRHVAGLDVGSTKTCAVVAEAVATGAGSALRVLGVGLAPSEGVGHHGVTDIEATTASIREALHEAEVMAGVEVESAFVGLSGPHVESETSHGVVAVEGDEIRSGEIARVHEVAQAVVIPPDRELLHVLPQRYAVDGRTGIRDPAGMSATRLEAEVCIVTAESAPCTNLRKAVDRAGYAAEELVLESLANSLAVLEERERDAGVALVEVGGASTDLMVLLDGRIQLLTTLPWGGLTVSSDIVKGLGIPVAEAERLKEQHGAARTALVDPGEKVEISGPTSGTTRNVSRELLAHIIEQRLDEMLGLAYEKLEEAGVLSDLGAGIVLTGGGVSLPGTIELAQGVFNMPVRAGVPGAGLTGLVDAVRKPKFATAVGLGLYGGRRRAERGGGPARRTLVKAVRWLRDFF